MEFEIWWLILLPVLFALGWFAARIDIKHLLANSNLLPRQYFEGLNHLLNNRHDLAIEVFADLARSHQQPVELQFALGHLFRRKGEVERAVQMHQTLLSRLDLSSLDKQAIQYELALDFMKAGLFDRAEELLTKLQNTDYSREARRHLLVIYQQEKDWQRAIEVAESLNDSSHQHEIAEFYCELAVKAMTQSQSAKAHRYLQQALLTHRKCVRASLLLGDLAAQQQQWQKAIDRWLKIESQNHLYLPMAAQRLLNAYHALQRDQEGTALLCGLLDNYPELDMIGMVYQHLVLEKGSEAAYCWLSQQIRRKPTVLGLIQFFEAQCQSASEHNEHKNDLEIMLQLLQAQFSQAAMYHCSDCGFKAYQYFWHCPACNAWESFFPIRGQHKLLEGDGLVQI